MYDLFRLSANTHHSAAPLYIADSSWTIDKTVKIWSTLPILDTEAEKNEENHKLLCTMSSHTGRSSPAHKLVLMTRCGALGAVLVVRWAHHGRFLASGSDDQVIMIWGMDQWVTLSQTSRILLDYRESCSADS